MAQVCAQASWLGLGRPLEIQPHCAVNRTWLDYIEAGRIAINLSKMPHISECQKLLNALSQAKRQLGVQVYLEILINAVYDESPPPSLLDTDSSSSSEFSHSHHNSFHHSESNSSSISKPKSHFHSHSNSASSNSYSNSDSSSGFAFAIPGHPLFNEPYKNPILLDFYNLIVAWEDEVKKTCTLHTLQSSTQIPQLQLLDEW